MKKLFFILMLSFASITTFAHGFMSLFVVTCTAHYTVNFVDGEGNFLRSETYTAFADDCAEAMRRAKNGAAVFIL